MHEGVKSGRQETKDILGSGSLMKSVSFPLAAVSKKIFRMCFNGAIQEVVMLPLNCVSFNSRVIKWHCYCIVSLLIILLISYGELCAGVGGLFLVSN